jgi:hypothetical protein
MTNAALTEENIDCLFGSLRRLLEEQRSGAIRGTAGDAGFPLELIPDGMVGGGIQRAPILSAIDGLWGSWDRGRRERTLPRFADALTRQAGIGEVNSRILKCGFNFSNGGFVPVNAAGEIPS